MKIKLNILQESLISTAFAAMILLLAVACHAGGYLHWESSAFLLNYTADRPFWDIIFDPDRNDWGFYQCRELSYILDWIDAHFVYFLLKKQLPWFISPVGMILVLFCIFLQQYAGRRLFSHLSGSFFTLHAAAMALLPCFTETIFYRNAKILTAASLCVLVFGTALNRLKNPGFWGNKKTLTAAALIAVSADRQGVFYVAAFTGLLAVEQILNRRHLRTDILRIGIAAVFFSIICNIWLVPEIIKSITGYYPDFTYQTNFSLNSSLIPGGIKFAAANLTHAFTGINVLEISVSGGILLFAVIAFILRKHRHIPCYLFPGAAVAVTLCSGVMVLRHPAIIEDDIIFSGYFVPAMIIMSFFFLAALDNLPQKIRKWSFLLPILAICLHLYPYLYPEMLFRDDKYQKVYQDATVKLKYVIENPDCDYRLLTMPYRMERLLEKLNSK